MLTIPPSDECPNCKDLQPAGTVIRTHDMPKDANYQVGTTSHTFHCYIEMARATACGTSAKIYQIIDKQPEQPMWKDIQTIQSSNENVSAH